MSTCNLLRSSSNITISPKFSISRPATETDSAQTTLYNLEQVTTQETIPPQQWIGSEIMETSFPTLFQSHCWKGICEQMNSIQRVAEWDDQPCWGRGSSSNHRPPKIQWVILPPKARAACSHWFQRIKGPNFHRKDWLVSWGTCLVSRKVKLLDWAGAVLNTDLYASLSFGQFAHCLPVSSSWWYLALPQYRPSYRNQLSHIQAKRVPHDWWLANRCSFLWDFRLKCQNGLIYLVLGTRSSSTSRSSFLNHTLQEGRQSSTPSARW
jgi:hypothetical protein